MEREGGRGGEEGRERGEGWKERQEGREGERKDGLRSEQYMQ